jgi:transposase-like protein
MCHERRSRHGNARTQVGGPQSTNLLKRLNEEIKRRTLVVRTFPIRTPGVTQHRKYSESAVSRARQTHPAEIHTPGVLT